MMDLLKAGQPARLALLARDGRTYEADLAQAKAWVERFFDLREERVQLALNELKELHAVKVRYEPPDLSETFTALRTVQARTGRPPWTRPVAAAWPARIFRTDWTGGHSAEHDRGKGRATARRPDLAAWPVPRILDGRAPGRA